MGRIAGIAQRCAYGVAVAAALGFGTLQATATRALAAPPPPDCTPGQCTAGCKAIGANSGFCDGAGCVCVFP
jgi:hypothetical protein